MRSPSSAPPVRRRVGSTEITAMRIPGKLARKRLSSSSVTEDLPAPPVPVMPITGVRPPASCHSLRSRDSSASSNRFSSSALSMRPTLISSSMSTASGVIVPWRASPARRTTSSIIATSPMCMPSLGW
jgi:hypothetical protein